VDTETGDIAAHFIPHFLGTLLRCTCRQLCHRLRSSQVFCWEKSNERKKLAFR
jgi:hypothetical protein